MKSFGWRHYTQYIVRQMDGQTVLYPRFLPKMLPKQGKTACVAGEIVHISENNSLTLQCDADLKQQLIIQVPGNIDIEELKRAKFIEVRGVVGETGDIVMREYTDLKNDFDLKTYNQIVNLAFKEFKEIFNYTD